MRFVVLVVFLLVAPSGYAYGDFSCVVKEVYALRSDGLLEPGKGFSTPGVGSSFIVNRQSGQITGQKITNSMSGVMPSVYSHMPSENSYSALTIYKPNYTIDLIQINEYVEGNQKPFLYKGAFGEVVTGTCAVQ